MEPITQERDALQKQLNTFREEKDVFMIQLAATAKQYDEEYSKIVAEKEKLLKELATLQTEHSKLVDGAEHGRSKMESNVQKAEQVNNNTHNGNSISSPASEITSHTLSLQTINKLTQENKKLEGDLSTLLKDNSKMEQDLAKLETEKFKLESNLNKVSTHALCPLCSSPSPSPAKTIL
jgi:uncharacterized coiled-coil DUF342 family protein